MTDEVLMTDEGVDRRVRIVTRCGMCDGHATERVCALIREAA